MEEKRLHLDNEVFGIKFSRIKEFSKILGSAISQSLYKETISNLDNLTLKSVLSLALNGITERGERDYIIYYLIAFFQKEDSNSVDFLTSACIDVVKNVESGVPYTLLTDTTVKWALDNEKLVEIDEEKKKILLDNCNEVCNMVKENLFRYKEEKFSKLGDVLKEFLSGILSVCNTEEERILGMTIVHKVYSEFETIVEESCKQSLD